MTIPITFLLLVLILKQRSYVMSLKEKKSPESIRAVRKQLSARMSQLMDGWTTGWVDGARALMNDSDVISNVAGGVFSW